MLRWVSSRSKPSVKTSDRNS